MTTLLTRSQLATLAAQGPAHRLPVFDAIAAAGGGLVLLDAGHRRFRSPGVEPLVTVVEDGPRARGPGAFDAASLRALLGEVHGAVVMTGAPVAWPYERTAALVGLGVSSLLVETTSAHGAAWRNFIHLAAPAVPVALLT